MRQLLRKTILATIFAMISVVASAHDFEVDGIYYNITSADEKTVEVTHYGNAYASVKYKGVVEVPAEVTYNGKTYAVTRIGEYAFYGCKVTQLTIPEGVTEIDSNAFQKCKLLTSFVIPSSVTFISYGVFERCEALTMVTCKASTPPVLATGAFEEDTFESCTLYVPTGSAKRYRSANRWEEFVDIKEYKTTKTTNKKKR